ncbi:MAG: ABC transporter permease [Anaerolineae bacterium]
MEEQTAPVSRIPAIKPTRPRRTENPYVKSLRHFVRNRFAMAVVVVLILVVFASVAAPLLTTSDPVGRDARNRLLPPSITNPMGTDELGRDVLTRVLYGGQISLQIGFLSVILSVILGVPMGLVAGYMGGKIDNILMRVMDLILAFPGLILVIWLVGLLGSSIANVILAIAVFSLPTYARLTRGITLSAQNAEYVVAARSLGASPVRVMANHVFPNILSSLIVVATLSFSGAIVTGASLSFLGLGVRPPTPEWGSLLAAGQSYLRNAWWISFFPGMVITLVVLALNIIGDALRDALDPTLTT